MKILLAGMNHESAAVEVRERFAVDDPKPLLEKLVAQDEIEEAVVVSTCNRVELCVTTHRPDDARHALMRCFAGEEDSTYLHSGRAAASHVLRVASSIDSMVVVAVTSYSDLRAMIGSGGTAVKARLRTMICSSPARATMT